MIEDIVIKSYEEQIKQSILKSEAVKKAGFDIIIAELERRGVQTEEVVSFFNKIRNSKNKEELDSLTIEELNMIVDNINMQVTKALISPLEISEILIRKSRIIAQEMSPNGKVNDTDNYVKVGANLASEIGKHGIAVGISICVKNYCIQRMYQINYREQLNIRKKKLGIEVEESSSVKKVPVKKKDTRKVKTMVEIFGREIADYNDMTFNDAKINYFRELSMKVNKLDQYK